MRNALIAAVTVTCLLVTPASAWTIREGPWVTQQTVSGRHAYKAAPLMDERSLHCHNTVRGRMRCHRGNVYVGPR